jgi:hypothetical protein
MESQSLPSTPEAERFNQWIVREQTEAFRSKPYIELAAMLQSMPRSEAENLLIERAASGKCDEQVVILCSMLFVDKNGSPFPGKSGMGLFSKYTSPKNINNQYGLGATRSGDWANWPIQIIDGVPFLVAAEHNASFADMWLASAPSPLAPVYLQYCLSQGTWTSEHFTVADLTTRQRALNALVKSPIWKRALNDDEIKYLTYQIFEENDSSTSHAAPLYIGVDGRPD